MPAGAESVTNHVSLNQNATTTATQRSTIDENSAELLNLLQVAFLSLMIHPLELWELVVLPSVQPHELSVHQRPSLLRVADTGFQLLGLFTTTPAQPVSGCHHPP